MGNLTLSTPALFFPAVSLIMLSYTNLFLALDSVVRKLHAEYLKQEKRQDLHYQIKNLRYRLTLVKNMQALAITCFLCCLISMYCIMFEKLGMAKIFFGFGVFAFLTSLVLYLIEINLSTRAIEIELGDMDKI